MLFYIKSPCLGISIYWISIKPYTKINLNILKQHFSYNLQPFKQLTYQLERMEIESGGSKLFRIKLILRNFGGNFILLLPLGMFSPMIFKKVNTIFKALLLGFLTSLAIELTEILEVLLNISRWGIAFDIDDIILNTLGAAIGYLVYKIFATLLQKFK
ncbi:VanZ family protein [Oceanirhabdus sp. W0125-5]|uniref:VanZ family protein n=1 Tax=Oceanirhabdus sp. W0125-5 TaxID=2999116 RepID=UPI0022F2CBFB|nr:VanZ family protein [Oceanirhabdus sp. W0125-5]WBW96205.1 VanZ family protein [Oceanirhabdus sp. W0125-5]